MSERAPLSWLLPGGGRAKSRRCPSLHDGTRNSAKARRSATHNRRAHRIQHDHPDAERATDAARFSQAYHGHVSASQAGHAQSLAWAAECTILKGAAKAQGRSSHTRASVGRWWRHLVLGMARAAQYAQLASGQRAPQQGKAQPSFLCILVCTSGGQRGHHHHHHHHQPRPAEFA